MAARRPLSICIVTADLLGPFSGSDDGPWHHALAIALSHAEHRVTVLSTRDESSEDLLLAYWPVDSAGNNIELISLPTDESVAMDAPVSVCISFEICQWLRDQEAGGRKFDIIHFPETRGPGFYSTLAKRQGLALQQTILCVGAHGPSLWNMFARGEFFSDLEDLQIDFIERQSIAQADVVVSPGPEMLDWMIDQGWKLPEHVEVRAFSPETLSEWIEWHENIVDAIPVPTPVVLDDPLVSICLTHHDRHKLLDQALASIRLQDYPHLEVVLVDDGSTDPSSLDYLAGLEEEFNSKSWQIIRQPNRYLGAARNNAARHARGEYLLFMDDDNIATPGEVSTFVKAARYSGADVLTCALDEFRGEHPPVEGDQKLRRWLPLGGAINPSVFVNLIGDANALVKKSTFNSLGGFTEDVGVGHEDWELFARAILRGYLVQVVPEVLFWYRVGSRSMLRSTDVFANHMRSLRPFVQAAPALRPTLEFAKSIYNLLNRRTADVSTLWDRLMLAEKMIAAQQLELTSTAEQLRHAQSEAATLAQRASLEIEARTIAERVAAEAQAQAGDSETRAIAAEARANASGERARIAEDQAAIATQRAAAAEAQYAEHVRLHGNADLATYQRIVDEHWNSFSWRLSAPLRQTLSRAPIERPIIHSGPEAIQIINSIRNSASWEAAGLFRVAGRLVNKLKGDKLK